VAGPKDRRPARHRAAPPSGPEEQPDIELDSYLKALAPKQDEDESELTGRFGSAQVFQLRLPTLHVEQLRKIAEERGVAPASLAGGWVIERLEREDPPTGPLRVVTPESEDADEPADDSERAKSGQAGQAKGSHRRWTARRGQ